MESQKFVRRRFYTKAPDVLGLHDATHAAVVADCQRRSDAARVIKNSCLTRQHGRHWHSQCHTMTHSTALGVRPSHPTF